MKKIGLSALAGTLASLSAHAGEMSVSGSAELSYVQRDNGEITGNPIGMNKNISFSGSGELDNGWTVSVLHAMNDTMSGNSSSSVSIGMGSLGTIAVDSGTGGYGLNAIDNIVPIAFEEADAGFDTGIVDAGSVVGTKNTVHWKLPTFMGANISAGYDPRPGSGHQSDGSTSGDTGGGQSGWEMTVDFSPEMVPGLRVVAGMGEQEGGSSGSNGQDKEEETYAATYAFGPLSVGYQYTEEDNGGSTNYETDVYGASFNVNDVFSISYQKGETEYKPSSGTAVTAKYTGISAAYNVGPMAIKFYDNSARDYNGSAGTDDDNRELNLSMSF